MSCRTLLAALAITALVILPACRPDARLNDVGPLTLPDSCVVSLADATLSSDTVARLRTLAPQLKATNQPITTKPDLVLTVKDTQAGTEELLTVWLEERFLYQGQYLDAWQERMTSDTVVGYRINADMERVLRGIHSQQN